MPSDCRIHRAIGRLARIKDMRATKQPVFWDRQPESYPYQLKDRLFAAYQRASNSPRRVAFACVF